VFEHFKRPTSRSVMQLHSPLTMLVTITKADLLLQLPMQ
jgi:hypothetical protein